MLSALLSIAQALVHSDESAHRGLKATLAGPRCSTAPADLSGVSFSHKEFPCTEPEPRMHYAEAFAVSLPVQSFGIDVFPL